MLLKKNVHVHGYVFQTPLEAMKNVKGLVEYLVEPCKTDVEKVRAFYYWVCNNIG